MPYSNNNEVFIYSEVEGQGPRGQMRIGGRL